MVAAQKALQTDLAKHLYGKCMVTIGIEISYCGERRLVPTKKENVHAPDIEYQSTVGIISLVSVALYIK